MSRRRDPLAACLFLLPATLLLAVFVIYPMASLAWVSLHDWNILRGQMRFVGLANYRAVLADEDFARAVVTTLLYVAGTVPLGMAISLGLALLVDDRLRAAGLFRTILFTPVVTSSVAAGIVFVWLLGDQRGVVNAALRLAGVEGPAWLQDPAWALPAVILMSLWKQAGYTMVLFLAGLQGIPASCYEAAAIDGARPGWQTFRHVTWPLLWPTTFFVLVVSSIQAFRAFEPMYVMTRGGPVGSTTTLVYDIFDRAFRFGSMGEAAAVSMLLLVVVMGITWVQFRAQGRDTTGGLG